jgi:putative acetyltransferase
MKMTEAILIRPAQDADLKSIATLFHEAIHQVAARDYTPQQIQAWSPGEQSVEHWVRRTAGLKVRIAEWPESPGTAAGFIGFSDDGYIDLLFTGPAFVRRGVASRLLQDAEAELRRNGVTTAFANVSHTARPFFAAMGYRCLQRQRVWCRSVELENFRMEKNLMNS